MFKLIKELLFGKPVEDAKPADKVTVKQSDLTPVITPIIMPMSSNEPAKVEAKKSSKKKAAVKKDPAVKKPRGRKPKATA